MGGKFPVVTDALERVVMTFVVTVLGGVTADGVGIDEALDLGHWKVWALAGVVAAFTLLKTLIAAQIAKRGGQAVSASLAPSVALQPVNADGKPLG